MEDEYIKGRGAQINPANPFHSIYSEDNGQVWHDEDEMEKMKKTVHIKTHAKSFLNKVTSPDIGMAYSMNPYQGCEHGCVYCYARNTHTYWGYSAGIEFEQKILIKENAPQLLDKKLSSKAWQPVPIMLSGNTDCYQPAEKKYQLTRRILEVLLKHRHPVGIITKNRLILRDLDLLTELKSYDLIKVSISLTTLNEKLRLKLEPRTASGESRLKVVKELTGANIPVNIMMAPIIPSLNDMEIFDIAKKTADLGASAFNYTIVRLNGDIGEIFKDWIKKTYPDRADRVLHEIESIHGGKLSDSRFGTRMKGEGNYAEMIKQQVKLAREKYFKGRTMIPYNLEVYIKYENPQLSFFL